MFRIQFPLKRCIRLTFVLLSGVRIEQDVWDYTVKHTADERVTSTAYTWAGERRQAILVRHDKIAAVLREPGPIRWQGWRQKP